MMQAVAWTLIHFLWQGTLVWILIAVQLRVLTDARTRYAVACLAMFLMLALPAATFLMLAGRGYSGESAISSGFSDTAMPFLQAAAPSAALPTPWMPLLVWLWASGVSMFSLRNAGGLIVAYLWRRRAVLPLPSECHQAAWRLARRLRLRCVVQLRGASDGTSPSVVGWMKPAIIVPAAVLGLPSEQLEAILAHELAHIRRRDFLINLLQNSIETLLFYHPAVWWLGRRIRDERENCCDDLAVEVCGDRATYACALTSLAALGEVPNLAVAATGGSLVRRIARLLGTSQAPTSASSVWPVVTIAVCSVAALAGGVLRPQAAATKAMAVIREAMPATFAASAAQQPDVVVKKEESSKLIAQVQTQPQQSQPATPATVAAAGSYIGELAAVGYTDLSVDELIAFKIHGVTAEEARAFQMLGLKPDPSQLVSMRIHGASPEYAQALRAAGFPDLTADQLVTGRIHGVSPDVVSELKSLGLGPMTFDDVVSARIHGVTVDFVRSLKDAGFSTLTFDQVITARIHGVDRDTARDLRDAGLGSLSFDDLVTAKIHAITPEFVRRAEQLGLKNLTFDKIVQLKIHGILD